MDKRKKRPFALAARMIKLWNRENKTDQMVNKSYDRISSGYDQTWTNHMRDKTAEMIQKLRLSSASNIIDLTCGTGYATNLLAQNTNAKVVGVDRSEGMLKVARENYSPRCEFIHSDIVDYLSGLEPRTVDVITCCWGLGYSKPCRVIRQIKRVLKKGGQVGIIDNTIFSLIEVVWCSVLTFMEYPQQLEHLMKFKFLTSHRMLWAFYKWHKFQNIEVWGGKKSYTVPDGGTAIERLRATGAAAGFEYASENQMNEQIFQRFAQIIEQKHKKQNGIKINHRYLAGVASKPQ